MVFYHTWFDTQKTPRCTWINYSKTGNMMYVLIFLLFHQLLHYKHRCPDKIETTPPPSTWSSVCLDLSWCRTEKCKPCFLILHHVCLRPAAEHTLQPPSIRPSPPQTSFKPALHALAPDPHWPPAHPLAWPRWPPLGWSGGREVRLVEVGDLGRLVAGLALW